MTKFRGCIDIHNGQVKQIVGASLDESKQVQTNHISIHSAGYFAKLYKDAGIEGVHVIKLGNGCDDAAKQALSEWPNHLQIGGGINPSNAMEWILAGACKVIVTSYIFQEDGNVSWDRLDKMVKAVGGKEKLVLDLSCKRVIRQDDGGLVEWVVAMNRWQTLTNLVLSKQVIDKLSEYCSEFLIHAADVEGLCKGIDKELVEKLGEWNSTSGVAITYAGGGSCMDDLRLVDTLSHGKIDLTFGSALDIFGGHGVTFKECVEWNKCHY